MNLRITNRRKLIRYFTAACVVVLSLIIADTLLGQSPQDLQKPVPGSGGAVQQRTPAAKDSLDKGRIDSINERISLLKKLAEEDQRRAAEKAAQEAASKVNTMPAMPQPETTANGTDAESSVFDPANRKPIDPPVTPFQPTLPKADPLTSKAAEATQVLQEPLDPFELGNSLFMTGNYEASIKSYQTILQDASAEDQVWLKCMMGCNFRLIGDLQKAEELFREVSNNRNAESYAVDYARWSLSYIESRRKPKEEFQVLEGEIDSILERMNRDSEGQ